MPETFLARLFPWSRKAARKPSRRPVRRLRMECLEGRQLLSGAGLAAVYTQASAPVVTLDPVTGADRLHVGKFEQLNGGTCFLDETSTPAATFRTPRGSSASTATRCESSCGR